MGLDNYGRILDNNIVIPNFDFVRILVFNLFWAFSNVVIHVVLGVIVALILNTKGLRLKRFYRAIFILPVVIPPIIVATVWRNMFDPTHGAINFLLQGTIGVLFKLPPDTFNIDWLNQPNPIIAVGPFILPARLLRAAHGERLAGLAAQLGRRDRARSRASRTTCTRPPRWTARASGQKFKTVTLPYLRPAMLPYAIYGFVITFNLFYLSYFMSGGGPFGQTELLVTTAYRLVNEQQLYGVAAAFAVFQFFILLAITLVTNRLAKATAQFDA